MKPSHHGRGQKQDGDKLKVEQRQPQPVEIGKTLLHHRLHLRGDDLGVRLALLWVERADLNGSGHDVGHHREDDQKSSNRLDDEDEDRPRPKLTVRVTPFEPEKPCQIMPYRRQ